MIATPYSRDISDVNAQLALLPGRESEDGLFRERVMKVWEVAEPGELSETPSCVVLTATTAMSEGFNFQDASVLINFDLPWTVLVLAQRMGRILRPWKEPREIYVYNLIPSTMENGKISHALRWKDRLAQRGKEYATFAERPVVVEKGSEFEMAELDSKIAARIKRLPPGIKSFKSGRCDGRYHYVLFRFRDRAYPALFDERGTIFKDSEMMDEIMVYIRPRPDEEARFPSDDIDFYDRWLQLSRKSWTARRLLKPDDASIIRWMGLG